MNIIKKLCANPSELTLETWEIHICDSTLDLSQIKFHKIIEIYIPEIKLAINKEGTPVNTFIATKERYRANRNDISGHKPNLINTRTINGHIVDTLKWLAETHKLQKFKQNELLELFET
jgi:hypothetical protein